MSGARASKTLCLLLGLLLVASWNPWSAGWLLSPDGLITSATKRGAVIAVELFGLLVVVVLHQRGRLPRRAPLVGLCLLLIGVGAFGTARGLGWIKTPGELRMVEELAQVQLDEELHLALVPRFKALGKDILELEVPGLGSRDLFTDQVTIRDLDAPGPARALPHPLDIRETNWSLSPEAVVAREDLELWRPLLSELAWVEHGKTYLVWTKHMRVGEAERAESEAGLKLVARGKDGRVLQAYGQLHVSWSFDSSLGVDRMDAGAWRVSELSLSELEVVSAVGVAFEEVLEDAIEDKALLRELRSNGSIDEVVKILSGEDWEPPYEYFQARSSDANEAVSVVDYDGDGHDDLYFLADVGRNVLLRNQGDGTFKDATEGSGLAFDGLSNVALFFDYDNDGDPDCFLGRSHATSRFLRNGGGRFTDVTAEVFGGDGPMLVESASAADLDADGLLDLYVSTYAGLIINDELARPLRPRDMVFDRQLRPEEARRYFRLLKQSENSTRDRPGPPNRLYQNEGGALVERSASPLAVFRNTYQATFSDYDGDGDQDVYVANDFAPNNMFRNDGGFEFVDVTLEANAADIGFGMGATFGDYDRDGDFDLYVSNMFSKAGRRITDSITGLDPRFGQMARGNSLLELEDGRFERVSSLDESGMQVEMSGWAWGAMFVDADLDTWPDLYSLAGYYTAPAPFESDVDL
ncbi:MAG: VCBS repeat-containing protein [Planctomycetes bacterium]|nr:VCBS repeat-containing protein [Planctomycetota bacterium]